MTPKRREPTRPGTVLLEEFLRPEGITQTDLAARMGVPIQRLNGIVSGRREVTAESAVLLGRALKTTPEFWMHLQVTCDIYAAESRMKRR